MTAEEIGVKIIAMNVHAVALGRLGGLKGGPARAASLTDDRRREIASTAARARWDKTRRSKPTASGVPDMRDRSARRVAARHLSEETGADVGVVEQVLFMQTLPAWERLARGLRRSRMRFLTC